MPIDTCRWSYFIFVYEHVAPTHYSTRMFSVRARRCLWTGRPVALTTASTHYRRSTNPRTHPSTFLYHLDHIAVSLLTNSSRLPAVVEGVRCAP